MYNCWSADCFTFTILTIIINSPVSVNFIALDTDTVGSRNNCDGHVSKCPDNHRVVTVLDFSPLSVCI